MITDVRMPPDHADDGLRAAVRLRERHLGLPVLVLSAHVSGPYAQALLAETSAGGVGYLLKERVGHVADFLSSIAVSKHVANVFTKLDLPPGEDNRRVRAVLLWLQHSRQA